MHMDKLKELLKEVFGISVEELDEEKANKLNTELDNYISKEEVQDALEEGWLNEDGLVDIDKIKNEELKGVFENLHKELETTKKNLTDKEQAYTQVKDELTDFKKKTGMVEVIKTYNPKDIEDIQKFIDVEKEDKDDKEYNWLKTQLEELKQSKPYLFEDEKGSKDKDPRNQGFNPSSNKKTDVRDYKSMSINDFY